MFIIYVPSINPCQSFLTFIMLIMSTILFIFYESSPVAGSVLHFHSASVRSPIFYLLLKIFHRSYSHIKLSSWQFYFFKILSKYIIRFYGGNLFPSQVYLTFFVISHVISCEFCLFIIRLKSKWFCTTEKLPFSMFQVINFHIPHNDYHHSFENPLTYEFLDC